MGCDQQRVSVAPSLPPRTNFQSAGNPARGQLNIAPLVFWMLNAQVETSGATPAQPACKRYGVASGSGRDHIKHRLSLGLFPCRVLPTHVQ